ncbi:General transcription factor 3C polypeptide 5 [Galdieria sulphuraria]|nr:General transcription factor 3C polypeptide 5 [Galdieria sulphuraria]
MERKYELPRNELVSVQVPVYLQEGNPAEVSKQESKTRCSAASTKRHDAYSIPLVSDTPIPSRDLLLKRWSHCKIVDIEALGIVKTTFCFTKLADFQFLPPLKETGGRLSGLDSSFGLFERDDLNGADVNLTVADSLYRLSPLQFSRYHLSRVPYDYRQHIDSAFQHLKSDREEQNISDPKENVEDEDGIDQQQIREKRRAVWRSSVGVDRRSDPLRNSLLSHRVSIDLEQVPQFPEKQKLEEIRNIPNEVFELLRTAFELRPIWTRRAIHLHIGNVDLLHIKIGLPILAYSFDGPGPFRTCWIKYGYDPRRDPESRKLQVLECRLNGSLADVIKSYRGEQKFALEASSERCNVTLCGLPTCQHLFLQLCDIESREIQELLQTCKSSASFSKEKYGWFPDGVWNSFRSFLRDHILYLIKTELGDEAFQKVLSSGKKIRDRSAQRKRLRRLRSLKERLQDTEQFQSVSSTVDPQHMEEVNTFENMSQSEELYSSTVEQPDLKSSLERSPSEFDEFQLLDEED